LIKGLAIHIIGDNHPYYPALHGQFKIIAFDFEDYISVAGAHGAGSQFMETIRLPLSSRGSPNHVVIGQVVGIHVADDVIVDGIIDIAKLRPLARLGYLDFAVIEPSSIFAMARPD
jgi:hypothetical protein